MESSGYRGSNGQARTDREGVALEKGPIWTECPPPSDSHRSSHQSTPSVLKSHITHALTRHTHSTARPDTSHPQHACPDTSHPRHSMPDTRGLLTPGHGTPAPRAVAGAIQILSLAAAGWVGVIRDTNPE